MGADILPATLVFISLIGGFAFLAVILLVIQTSAISSKNREKYKREKIVEDYYEGKEEDADSSVVSAQILKRAKQNLADVEEY
ncbi:MAG: hypothetical protein P9M12_05995 [Candidatus Aceula lacicola]|nr:hypothetical protein [Candidatus Aceula lacicola]